MKKILYISLVDWYWIKQRPQHFAEILSKDNLVTYLCIKNFIRDPSLRCHGLEDDFLDKSIINLSKNLKIVRITEIPKQKKYKFILNLNQWIYRQVLLRLDRKINYDFIFISHPNQYNMLPPKLLAGKKVIYDCMDNYLEFNGINKKQLLENENAILELCHHVIVSSKNLYQKLIKRKSNIVDKISVINNGVDTDRFNLDEIIKSEENLIRKNNKVKIGYIGTISNWVNLDLIKRVAEYHQEFEFYFIGPKDDNVDISHLKDLDNIIFTGTQSYYKIPELLKCLTVAIMPFEKTELILSVNPVKIYEYLSLGKPVVALRYEETEVFGDLIYTYETEEEFEKKICAAIDENDSKYKKRIEFANKNSWVSRVNNLKEILNKYA
jgi:teichuronic acid biosynthesis glycosyltransferase TuaH